MTVFGRLHVQLTNPVERNRLSLLATTKRDPMRTKSLLLTIVISAGLACGVAAQVREQPGEMVQIKSLPASVQQTINQKAAGGEIVRVKREDDTNGRWNYEVVVRSQGKEWGFEVDPNGKLLRTHGEKK
jgi:hypothetical protein